MDQTGENGQKRHFLQFRSSINLLASNNPVVGKKIKNCWEIDSNYSTLQMETFGHLWKKSFLKFCIKIFSKSVILTQDNGQKAYFLAIWVIQKAFLWLLNDQAWVIHWPKHANYLVLLKYAISSQSDAPNSRKWPRSLFLAIWIIQKSIFVIFEWSSMGGTMANS